MQKNLSKPNTMTPGLDLKTRAIEFYRMAYEGSPQQAADTYIGKEYIQHNPDVEDGLEGFIRYFDRMHIDFPKKCIRFLRAVQEDNLVALHTHQTWPGKEEYITMDFFRFDQDGKIVEHWDSIQLIPKESKNGNTMT